MEEIQRALFVAQISNDSDALYLLEKLLIQLNEDQLGSNSSV